MHALLEGTAINSTQAADFSGAEIEEDQPSAQADESGWRVLDVLNEAVPDMSSQLLGADERSIHMSLSLEFLTTEQKAALGLIEALSLDYK